MPTIEAQNGSALQLSRNQRKKLKQRERKRKKRQQHQQHQQQHQSTALTKHRAITTAGSQLPERNERRKGSINGKVDCRVDDKGNHIDKDNGNRSTSDEDSSEDELFMMAAAAAWATDGGGDTRPHQCPSSKAKKRKRRKGQAAAAATTTTTTMSGTLNPPNTSVDATPTSRMEHGQRLPPPFPLKQFPQLETRMKQSKMNEFLRDEGDHRHAFQSAMSTCYEGCVWDRSADLANPQTDAATVEERDVQSALSALDHAGWFRTDVTQPAGMGSRCVKTYVTRCLLGDPGTTYKYLGLRMFSHPWCDTNVDGMQEGHSAPPSDAATEARTPSRWNGDVQAAVDQIHHLNQCLTQRTQRHLEVLGEQRRDRNVPEPTVQGRAGFSVTLINKMKPQSSRLKDEPMFGESKCTVSWHADSSLEHFSTIAVYQTMFDLNDFQSKSSSGSRQQGHVNGHAHGHADAKAGMSFAKKHERDWSIALRVTHNAEGPKQKRLGDISVEKESPPIAVTLQSGCAYYLLDDHNHHHQHAVLAPTSSSDGADADQATTTRFSSTHRLLRAGHNVHDMIHKCRTAVDNFHRNGPKRWRSEQITLDELENEWLRQFFIQGREHKHLLWAYWEQPVMTLFRHWEQLEQRTYDILCILQHAAEHHCETKSEQQRQQQVRWDKSSRSRRTTANPSHASARSFDSSRHKQCSATIHDMMGSKSPRQALYESIATILQQRSKKRSLWLKRESDPIFKRTPVGGRPIPFPVAYGKRKSDVGASGSDGSFSIATSSMPNGSPSYLSDLAEHVQQLGVCFESRKLSDLPGTDLLELVMTM